MPITKHHLYPQRFNQLSNTFRILGCPARLTILKYLLDQGASNNKELVQHVGLSQSSVSEHLRQLISIDLVEATPLDTSIIYRINGAVWQNMPWLHNLFNED